MTYEEYMRYLLSGQIQPFTQTDPFAPAPMYGSQVGGMLPAYDYGDLGDQAKALNITQDYADIYSDPAVLGGYFGEMPAPDQLQSFTPNPGYMKLQNALAKPGTLEAMIAEEILAPDGSAASAMSLINKMIADGTIPEGLVPQYTDDMGNLKYDTSYVKELATSFQNDLFSDPMPTAEQGGLPGVGEMAKNPLADWYRNTNTPLPNQQYVGDDLATQQQLLDMQTLPAQDVKYREVMKQWADRADRASRNPAEFLAPPEGMAAGQQGAQAPQQSTPSGITPQRGGWADDLERITQGQLPGRGIVESVSKVPGFLDRNIGDPLERLFGGGGGEPQAQPQGARQPQASGQRQTPRNQGSQLMDQMLGRQEFGARQKQWNPNATMQKSMQDEIAANRAYSSNAAKLRAAETGARERENIARALAAQGHTPYNDTMAQRRLMAQYMGFGI